MQFDLLNNLTPFLTKSYEKWFGAGQKTIFEVGGLDPPLKSFILLDLKHFRCFQGHFHVLSYGFGVNKTSPTLRIMILSFVFKKQAFSFKIWSWWRSLFSVSFIRPLNVIFLFSALCSTDIHKFYTFCKFWAPYDILGAPVAFYKIGKLSSIETHRGQRTFALCTILWTVLFRNSWCYIVQSKHWKVCKLRQNVRFVIIFSTQS